MNQPEVRELASGATLAVEPMSGVRSAGFTWLLPAGFASEPASIEGVSTIASEVLQRGTKALDSREQANAFDRAGATRSINAGGRSMAIRATTVGDRLSEALPLIADMVRTPRIDAGSFEPSRELCLQSLASLQDEPRERAALEARARHLRAPLNRSGYGTEAGLANASPEVLAEWWSNRARPDGSIIAVAGAVDADSIEAQLNELLDGWTGSAERAALAPDSPGGYGHLEDDTNQVQVIVLLDAPPEADEDAALLHKVATNVLSGGMSGRLFTEVREKRGLCYAVSASYRGDRDFGVLQGYVGTTPERAQDSIDVLAQEFERLGRPGGEVTQEEFDRAITGMKAGVVFHGESTGARAGAIAGDFQRLGRARSLTEITERIDRVKLSDLNEHLAAWRPSVTTVQTLGPASLKVPETLGGS